MFGKDRFAKVRPGIDQQPSAAPVAAHDASSTFGLFDYTLFENTAFYEGPEFYVHDHLGNTRVVYTPVVGTSSIAYTLSAAIDYFPYGKELRSYYNGEEERYLTTHHERDGETGLDYRGARFYDSDNGRFLSLDPRADEFASWSPYNYVFSDPIKYTDPDGKGPFLVIPLIWAAVELGFAIYDSYDLVTTLTDPNASTSDKLITAGGFAIGALGPGGGYGTAGKAGVKGVDNLVTTAGKNLPTPAGGKNLTSAPAPKTTSGSSASNQADFAVDKGGTAVPLDQQKFKQGLDNAGYPSVPTTKTAEKGVIYPNVPTKTGTVDVRVMPGAGQHSPRTVITHPSSPDPGFGPPKTPSGTAEKVRYQNHINQHNP